MEAVVLHRVGFIENFCPKQGQDFKPSTAPLYPNMSQVPPAPLPPRGTDADERMDPTVDERFPLYGMLPVV